MLVKNPLLAESTGFASHTSGTPSEPISTVDSESEARYATAFGRDRIEYHFHASTRLCLNVRLSEDSVAENGRDSDERPGRTASGFVLDAVSDTASGRFGARLTGVSVALQLFNEDKTLWGTISTGSAPAYRAGLPHGMSLLHQDAALCFETGASDAKVTVPVDVRCQANVSMYLDESLIGQIPMATLAQLARLSECYFRRIFKRSFGFFPRGFRVSLRIVTGPEVPSTRGRSERKTAMNVEFFASGEVAAVPFGLPR